MATSTARTQYRELVAQVAERAKAILPQAINGRLEGAVALVLQGDVEPQADGSIQVGSCTDPAKVYRLVGTTCECKDFTAPLRCQLTVSTQTSGGGTMVIEASSP
jgi:hypothetical protein